MRNRPLPPPGFRGIDKETGTGVPGGAPDPDGNVIDDGRIEYEALRDRFCPCENEQPDPCTFCGEPAFGGGPCRVDVVVALIGKNAAAQHAAALARLDVLGADLSEAREVICALSDSTAEEKPTIVTYAKANGWRMEVDERLTAAYRAALDADPEPPEPT